MRRWVDSFRRRIGRDSLALMKTYVLGLVPILGILGCVGSASRNHSPTHAQLLAIWNSRTSSAQDRADAINKLVAQGTDEESIERQFPGGVWNHYTGPTADLIAGTVTAGHDFWQLEYTNQYPLILALEFHGEYPSRVFEHAWVMRQLTTDSSQ